MINSLILAISILIQTSFYSLGYDSIAGNPVSMNSYQGKKVLLVNIATGSSRIGQLAQLQQLQAQHADSLVVIAFPSNSFNNEPLADSAIQSYCQGNYGITFPLATKGDVKGTNIQPVYNWFALQTENGVMNGTVVGDFQKFLVDKNGALIGVFGPTVEPMSTTVQNAILGNQ